MRTTRTPYGLTGQIGAGKTYVGKLLTIHGCAIYNADEKARELLNTNVALREEIIKLLGHEAFTQTGAYNREYVARKIFSTPPLRLALESLIHPAVFSDFTAWKEKCKTQHPFVFMESALLPRLDWHPHFRSIILITAPAKTRLARIIQRDNTTRERAEERLLAQPTDFDYYTVAHFVIENSPRFNLENQLSQLIEILKLQHAD